MKHRHSNRALKGRNVKAGATGSIVTMVWSGGADWVKSKAHIVALSSVLPGALSTFTAESIVNAVTYLMSPTLAKSIPGTVTISFGGSNAGDAEWTAMAAGGVAAWATFFNNVFVSTGLHGIDWDLEGIVTPSVYDFVGQLSQKLKSMDPTYVITFTVFGNVAKQPPVSFFNNYLSACDYVVFMLYNGGPWNAASASYGSWCDYLSQSLKVLPAAVQSKFLYATYPMGGTFLGCAPMIQQMVDNVRAGKGAGVAFWCYGGYNGACETTSIGSTSAKGVVEAWVDILNAGGGSGVSDFQTAFPNCTGPLAENGCGYVTNSKYACVNNACIQYNNNTYPLPSFSDSTCGGTCSGGGGGGGVKYACVNGTCQQSPTGTYSDQTCGGTCGTTAPKYGCVNGVCQQSPTGTYPDQTCGGTCGTTAPKYGCVNGTCQQTPNGAYLTKTCNNMCTTGTSKYSCVSGACQPDPTAGKYSNSYCDNACGAPPACASLGMPVNSAIAGAACKNPSAQFTCNGSTRCCCPGTVPVPTATNPTGCAAPTAAELGQAAKTPLFYNSYWTVLY